MGVLSQGFSGLVSFGVCASNGKKLLASISRRRKKFPVMCLTFGGPTANLDTWISTRCPSGRPFGVVRRAMGAGTLKSSQTSATGTAMTTVDAVTAGSGDTYRIERVYLDRDQAYGFVQDCNEYCAGGTGAGGGVAAVPAGGLRRPGLAGRVVGAGAGQQASRSTCGTPATANGATTSISAGNGGPGTPCRSQGRPSQTRRGTQGRGGGPVERESHGNLGKHDCPAQSRSSQSLKEVISALSGIGWKQMGVVTRHCRPGAS